MSTRAQAALIARANALAVLKAAQDAVAAAEIELDCSMDELDENERDALLDEQEMGQDQEDFLPDGRFDGIPRNWMGEPC